MHSRKFLCPNFRACRFGNSPNRYAVTQCVPVSLAGSRTKWAAENEQRAKGIEETSSHRLFCVWCRDTSRQSVWCRPTNRTRMATISLRGRRMKGIEVVAEGDAMEFRQPPSAG